MIAVAQWRSASAVNFLISLSSLKSSRGMCWSILVGVWALCHLAVSGEKTDSATNNGAAATPTTTKQNATAEVVIGSDGTVSLIDPHKQQQLHPLLPDFPVSYIGPIVSSDHDFSAYQHKSRRIQYPEYVRGDNPYKISAEAQRLSDGVARSRRYHVRNAMKHAWDGYREYAFGFDELLPVSKKGRNNWGGMGTTLVDSLDTLWLMGLKNEFNDAAAWVREHLDHSKVGSVSVFETTIRSLGGLLSAYDLTGDQMFLKQADDLGSRLMKSFDTESGIPFGRVNLKTGQATNAGYMRDRASLAEFATLQVEFRYLAKATGNIEYAQAVERIFQIVEYLQPEDGLIPIYAINTKATPMLRDDLRQISFGAHGDSAYEYMLKIWIQGEKKEMMYRHMYEKSIDGLHKYLLKFSTPSGLAYVTQRQERKTSNRPIYVHTMEHLVCYLPGVLALGAYTDPFGLESDRAKRDLKTARALAYTCYEMYQQMETGLAAEYVSFNEDGQDLKAQNNSAYYLLRPEVVESFYVLNKLTGDPIYREFGWKIFQSIERYCKLPVAYGKVADVNNPNEEPKDHLESFMMSETLKYLYLLFDPDSDIDILETHVFNTEAHALRRLGDPLLKKGRHDSGPKEFPHLGAYPKPTDFATFLPPGGGRFDEYREGVSPYNISPEMKKRSDDLARQRRTYIVGAMKHAWEGYREYAFGHDEVLPKSKKGNDPWGGMGTTLVDSLDTLWLMGLKTAFYEGRDWVRDHLDHDNVATVSVFETTIRSLGGLLSAYDLSRDFAFLEKADDLGSRLLKAFDSPSGIPYGQVHLQTGEASNIKWVASSALLAEYATLQVEFRYLAKVIGTKEYALKSEKIFEIIEQLQPESGLLSLQTFNLIEKPRFSGTHISFGAMVGLLRVKSAGRA